MMYNATVELDTPADIMATDAGDDLLDRFIDYHPAIARSTLGRAELILSLPAESLWQATTTVRALTTALAITRVIVETTADFDRRSQAEVPELLSVTEVAQRLGLTRAGVQRRIETGSLPAVRVGSTWVIPAAALAA